MCTADKGVTPAKKGLHPSVSPTSCFLLSHSFEHMREVEPHSCSVKDMKLSVLVVFDLFDTGLEEVRY